jgi:hypothetical protein
MYHQFHHVHSILPVKNMQATVSQRSFFLIIKHAVILYRLKRENRGGLGTLQVDPAVNGADQGRDKGSVTPLGVKHAFISQIMSITFHTCSSSHAI